MLLKLYVIYCEKIIYGYTEYFCNLVIPFWVFQMRNVSFCIPNQIRLKPLRYKINC